MPDAKEDAGFINSNSGDNVSWIDPEGLMRGRRSARAQTVNSIFAGEGDGGIDNDRGKAEIKDWGAQAKFVAQRFNSQSANNSSNNPFNAGA